MRGTNFQGEIWVHNSIYKGGIEMKVVTKIMGCIVVYLAVILLITSFFSRCYSELISGYTFSEIFMYSISNNMRLMDIPNNSYLFILLAIHNLCQTVCTAVMTGYIFNYIIHKEPNLTWPVKLVIRRSRQTKKLKLGIMIGNKTLRVIHEVNCTVCFSYIVGKKTGNRDCTNKIEQDVMTIENYNRFSFDLDKLPYEVLKRFLDKNTDALKDVLISVYIRGNFTKFGKPFLLCHQYSLRDVCIVTGDLEYETSIGRFKKVLWNAVRMKKLDIVDENEKAKMIDDIRKILAAKENPN